MGKIAAYEKKLAAPGDLPEAFIRWTGPSSYTRVTAGTPASGGDPLVNTQLGTSGILSVEFAGTYTGNFSIVPVRISEQQWALQWRALRTETIGGQSQTTGTEAAASTDLSGENVRLHLYTRSA